ncbi:anti-sigma factor [Oligoflexus tunisiensis]|uniref:anti-sigma factor n=1 Tax=Oligoflexus tunisiensis TaxID=708132 RepID=UPI00114CEBF1|nr:anti-sigma factor [Oligoflexus tunisiensis]
MSKDKHSGSDPEFAMSPEDEAFLRLVEDSYEAAGRPKDQAGADRVWGKLEARLAADANPPSVGSRPDAPVRSISSTHRRRGWIYVSGILGAVAALLLFLNSTSPVTEESPGTMPTRGTAAGFSASIIVYDDRPAAAPAGSRHQIKVNVTADADGYVALFRQQGEPEPVFVANLEYKKEQGDMHILEENAVSGTRYCILGAQDQEGLKHLIEIIGQLWAYLPENACYTVP